MRTLHAEALKAVTLPRAWAAALAGVAALAGLVALVRAGAPGTPADRLLAAALPLAQAGPVAVGALLAGHEHRGGQARSSALAVPRRGWLLVARAVIWLLAAVALAAASVAAGALAAGGRTPGGDRLLPPVVLLAGLAYAGSWAAEATRSAVAGTAATLAVVWVAPAVVAWPRLRAALPDAGLRALAGGAWPEHPAAVVAWLAGLVAVSAVVALRREP